MIAYWVFNRQARRGDVAVADASKVRDDPCGYAPVPRGVRA